MRANVLILGTIMSLPASALGQDDALNRIEQRLDRIEQRLGDVPAPEAVADGAPAGNPPPGDQRWRYKFHNGAWWYWLPSDRWVYWSDGAWVNYDPATHVLPYRVYRYPVYDSGDYYGGYYSHFGWGHYGHHDYYGHHGHWSHWGHHGHGGHHGGHHGHH